MNKIFIMNTAKICDIEFSFNSRVRQDVANNHWVDVYMNAILSNGNKYDQISVDCDFHDDMDPHISVYLENDTRRTPVKLEQSTVDEIYNNKDNKVIIGKNACPINSNLTLTIYF